MSDNFISKIDTIAKYRKELNPYALLVNSESYKIPIGQLLANMDTDENKNLTTEEIFHGLLANCSDTLNLAMSLCDFSETEDNIEEKLKALGINPDDIKGSIHDQIGDTGIDLNNLTTALSQFLGCDVNKILDKANKYGLDIKIEDLSIQDILDFLDDVDSISKEAETQEMIESGISAYKNYKKGNYFEATGNCATAYSNLFSLNLKSDDAVKYTDMIIDKTADKVEQNISNSLGNNFFSTGVSYIAKYTIKGGGRLLSGTTLRRIIKWF